MIFFSVVLIGAVIFQLSLLLTTKPIFYSELFYYPWLVSKGLMPYRDFFDNHGFLLYYVLSPFVQVKSLLALNIFYIGLKLGILVLIFSILMRITNKVGLLVGSLLAIILLTYSSANTFWFEHVIAFLYLLAFFISTKEFKLKGFVVGTIVVGASLIKPQAALIMIPLWLSYPRFNFLITFCAGWGLVGLFLLFNNMFIPFIDNVVLFNKFYSHDIDFHLEMSVVIIALFILLLTALINKQTKLKNNYNITLYVLISTIFVYPQFTYFNLVPFFCLLIIQISRTINLIKHNKIKYFTYLSIVLVFVLFMGRKAYREYKQYKGSSFYSFSETSLSVVNYLKSSNLSKKRIYLMSNNLEIYYLLNKLPPDYFPLKFYLFIDYYDLSEVTLEKMIAFKPEVVIRPLEKDQSSGAYEKAGKYVEDNFQLVWEKDNYKIYLLESLIKKSSIFYH